MDTPEFEPFFQGATEYRLGHTEMVSSPRRGAHVVASLGPPEGLCDYSFSGYFQW